MNVLYGLDQLTLLNKKKDFALTLGNFDGLHLGHQNILNQLEKISKDHAVITFSNHPSEIIRPETPIHRLCKIDHKLLLLKKYHINNVVVLNFTKELSFYSPKQFIDQIRQYSSFTHLILGYDATIGHNRQGNADVIKEIAAKQNFFVDYVPATTFENSPISSSLIRQFVKNGDLEKVEKLLGRKYSVYLEIKKGIGQGKAIGFPTINFNLDGLCTPPKGVYFVKVILENKFFWGVANLGVAPTVKNSVYPELEVHLFDCEANLYGFKAEIIFYQFIRAEKKFDSVAQLKEQISNDVHVVQNLILKLK